MIQVILKDKREKTIAVLTSVDKLSELLNDQSIKTIPKLSHLISYLMANHYRTTIKSVPFYLSNMSFGIGNPATFTFTELELVSHRRMIKVVLKEKDDTVISEQEMDYNRFAQMLNDPAISNINSDIELEIYISEHHFHTIIKGRPFWYKKIIMANNIYTYIFEEL